MRKLSSLIFLFFVSLNFYAQDIEVKKFEPMVKDQTAILNPRMDIYGTVCGLMKIALEE